MLVEKNAGAAIGLGDALNLAASAELADTPQEVFARAALILKVKKPQLHECRQPLPDQILFTYLQLAADPGQSRLLPDSGVTAIACETATSPTGGLPLLAPMSEVAGRMAIQAATCLEMPRDGAGMLLGGVPGVSLRARW